MQGYEPGISLCMIVKDEETFLRGSLDSIKSVVDEMIIIDTGSGDSSVQIAHDAGATVIETEWSDDFSMARNLSLGKANYEWILVLDADERISFSDYPRLRRLMELSDFFGFRLDQRSYVHHSNLTNAVPCVGEYAEEMKYPGYIPQDVVRFFRNYSAIEYRGRVHEIVEHSMIENHLSIEKSGIPIHHYGKVVEPERLIKKMNHYI
ncbi:MAG: glycosyltransferase family 2 protein, partial [Candidatus Marinimicrobia bacterium]|nr:glycosyltransferase family 2 protein [Candidatus Neomarinimicrobiota bacterium]